MILHGVWRSLGVNVLNLALPPQRLRPDTRPEHQDPASHTAQKKRKKKRNKQTDRTPNQVVKAKQNRQNHAKIHTHTYS